MVLLKTAAKQHNVIVMWHVKLAECSNADIINIDVCGYAELW